MAVWVATRVPLSGATFGWAVPVVGTAGKLSNMYGRAPFVLAGIVAFVTSRLRVAASISVSVARGC